MIDARDSVAPTSRIAPIVRSRAASKAPSNPSPRSKSVKAPSPARSARTQPPARKPSKTSARKQACLPIPRVFSQAGVHPFDQIDWERRTAEISDDAGKVIFKQDGVEVPSSWSQLATKVVCSKYFYGDPAKPEREQSVRQLIHLPQLLRAAGEFETTFNKSAPNERS